MWVCFKSFMLSFAFGVPYDFKYRRRQTEIQSAVAEAELDLCTATAHTLDSRDLAEASAEDVTKAKRVVVEEEEELGGQTSDSSVDAAEGFGAATGTVLPDESRGDQRGERRGTALEPGEVPM